MRKSWVQLYAPFLVLMIVQALFVAVAPSRGPSSNNSAQLSAGDFNNGSSGSSGSTDSSGGLGDLSSGGAGSSGDSSSSSGSGSGSGGDSGGGGSVEAQGSTTHCKDGQQHKLVVNNPAPCVPKFTGDNGGATYQGVTKDTIKVIRFRAKPNEQVDAILGAKGLSTTAEDDKAAQETFLAFINKYYEFYGRKVVIQDIVGNCPTSPPDQKRKTRLAQSAVPSHPGA